MERSSIRWAHWLAVCLALCVVPRASLAQRGPAPVLRTPSDTSDRCQFAWSLPALPLTRAEIASECENISAAAPSGHCGCAAGSDSDGRFAPCKRDASQQARDKSIAALLEHLTQVLDPTIAAHWRVRAVSALQGEGGAPDAEPKAEGWRECWWQGPDSAANARYDKAQVLVLTDLLRDTSYRKWISNTGEPSDPNAYDVTRVKVETDDKVFWLGSADTRLVKLEPPKDAGKLGERELIRMRNERGWIVIRPAVEPPTAPAPLIFAVNPGQAELDTTGAARTSIHVRVTATPGQSASIDGYSIPGDGKEFPLVIQPQAPPLLVVREGARFIQQSVLDRNIQHDFSMPAAQLGLLPVSLIGCQAYGIDEEHVKERVTGLLGAWGTGPADLGLQAAIAKGYIAAAHGGEGTPEADRALKGSLDTSVQLQNYLDDLFQQGFSRLLDIRLTCSRTPQGEDVFSVSATLVTLASGALNEGDQDTPAFLKTTKVVKGLDRLNVATSSALATLWNKRALLLDHAPNELGLLETFGSRVEMVRPSHEKRSIPLRVSVVKVPEGSDACDRVQAWNELRGDASLLAKLPASARTIVAGQDTNSVPLAFSVRAPGQYLLQVRMPGKRDSGVQAAVEGREVFACFRALPPTLVAGATYFSPDFSLSVNRAQSKFPETRNQWQVLGFMGQPTGIGIAFGVSNRTRRGVGPSSWDDTTSITTSDSQGTVGYVMRTFSLYPGVSFAERWYLSRRWSFDARGFALLRLDFYDTSGVPDELAAFKQVSSSGVDATFAATGAISVALTSQLSLHCAALLEVPRASAWFVKLSEEERRTVYYDPHFFLAALGLGVAYTWQP